MRVRLKASYATMYPEFTLGNVYRVLEMSTEDYRIICDDGAPALWPHAAFVVTDPRRSPDWVDTRDEDGAVYSHAPDLQDPPHLFEKWFDYDVDARRKLSAYLHKVIRREAAQMPNPPNTYLRVEWKHEHPNEPVVLYCELDEERYEIRKVDEFRDGRLQWASLRGGAANTTLLGKMPTPSIGELNADPQFVATEIDRAAFESVFDRAFDDFDP